MSNHAFDVDGLDREVVVQVIDGPEGRCLAIDDLRVAGPKPWGGGIVIVKWTTTARDLLEGILGRDAVSPPTDETLRALAGSDAYGFHTEHRRRQTPLIVAALQALADEPAPEVGT